jgi:hypothetical protein
MALSRIFSSMRNNMKRNYDIHLLYQQVNIIRELAESRRRGPTRVDAHAAFPIRTTPSSKKLNDDIVPRSGRLPLSSRFLLTCKR